MAKKRIEHWQFPVYYNAVNGITPLPRGFLVRFRITQLRPKEFADPIAYYGYDKNTIVGIKTSRPPRASTLGWVAAGAVSAFQQRRENERRTEVPR